MVTIKKVTTKKELTAFVDFQYDLFADDPCYAPPLFMDEYNCLDKTKNACFEFCEAEYFLAMKDGKVAGRVAAIINHKANEKWGRQRVRFGWFDFIDDREVSGKLLDAVEDYGRQHGMKEIAGPFGFTDLDKEGMLVEGFDQMGTTLTAFGAPYYKDHIRARKGYNVELQYVELKLECPDGVPERHRRVANIVEKKFNLHIYKPSRFDLMFRGDGRRIFELINETYKDVYGVTELTPKQIDQYISQYIPFVDPGMIGIIRDHNTPDKKMVGFGLSMPSLATTTRKLRKGRLLPFGWWHLLKKLFFEKHHPVIDLMLIGVLPEYRTKGANALLFADFIPRYLAAGMVWAESQIQIVDNTNAITQWDGLKEQIHKRRECYKAML